jgi:hypothetical protein
VAQGEVRYFITESTGIGGAGGGDGSRISTWVRAHFRAIKVGGQTVYDLSKPDS